MAIQAPERTETSTSMPFQIKDTSFLSIEPGQLRVINREGVGDQFDGNRIMNAIKKAFIAVEGDTASQSDRVQTISQTIAKSITETFKKRWFEGGVIHLETIQDQVELELMRAGEREVARAYVLYREKRRQARELLSTHTDEKIIHVILEDGSKTKLDLSMLSTLAVEACQELTHVNPTRVIEDARKNLFDGVAIKDVYKAMVMSARTLVETEPNYTYVTARLLLRDIYQEALDTLNIPHNLSEQTMHALYPQAFIAFIEQGITHELLHPNLKEFDLEQLSRALDVSRDKQFTYLSIQTLYDRYFIHHKGNRIELPQVFFMRVAMGLAHCEGSQRNERAIEFYNLLSSFDYMSSTPTLFNSGTLRPQLSSCYLTTIPDDLDGIYGALKDNALLSKFAGGLGNDWTPVRAMGAYIKGTNGKSLGVVPFLNVADATAVAVNQCFAPDTLLFTADGVKAIKEVKKGDLVLGQRGQYREVLDHMLYNQTDAMVELNIKHAIRPLTVTAGHPIWAIQNVPAEQSIARTLRQLAQEKHTAQWTEAGELKAHDYIGQTIPQEIVPINDFTEDDARLYGILLGDGHLTDHEWGVSGNPQKDQHLTFVMEYLESRGIHYWVTQHGNHYQQVRWSAGHGLAREGTTGQFISAGNACLPFEKSEIYNDKKQKHIGRRFTHLPLHQTRALIKGLLETDGGVSRGKEIYFTSTSEALAEGVRYQLLRLGIPCSGQYRVRPQSHTDTREHDEKIQFSSDVTCFDLRIPAVPEIAELVDCQPVTKRNWFIWNKTLFTRLKSIKSIVPTPFVYDLKVEGDESYMTTAALAHNGGKRKGAVCAYLETWHLDIEEFLELRKNTGDERRRTHDMNTANWIPDLFMKRLFEGQNWTLFTPDETPDLHDLYGEAFEKAYVAYEKIAARGEIRSKTISAVTLWRKMLGMLFETGHPWVTFKDPCNIRSPQQHVGVVHSSNLCTEITLNTKSNEEIAVCNLGSVNLVHHMKEGKLDQDKLKRTIKTAIRMLDNVIDINYYSVDTAKNSNVKHRPIGLGLMGFQDALYLQNIPYASEEAVEFADRSMELISYYAIQASSDLARERGTYETYPGSLWDQGIFPIDSIELLKKTRGDYLSQNTQTTLDWETLRETVKTQGMRNSNVMAIAPTATISNICGVSQSIEPTYQNLFVKSNLSGEFTVVNPYLVRDLKARNLWDQVMIHDLKYHNGSVQLIDRIPTELKTLYASAFEVAPKWLVMAASRRQKWIDQAQSLNLYMAEPSGKKLDQLYRNAWLSGLKTTYYLRSMGATSTEKATITDGQLNAVKTESAPKACSIDDPDCEACQ